MPQRPDSAYTHGDPVNDLYVQKLNLKFIKNIYQQSIIKSRIKMYYTKIWEWAKFGKLQKTQHCDNNFETEQIWNKTTKDSDCKNKPELIKRVTYNLVKTN